MIFFLKNFDASEFPTSVRVGPTEVGTQGDSVCGVSSSGWNGYAGTVLLQSEFGCPCEERTNTT